MTVKVNWLFILMIPLWGTCFYETWGHPSFWILIMLLVKDWELTSKFEI